MPSTLDQLLRDVSELTGVTPPAWLADEAPVLSGPEPFYLVGLIGGKDVGKSALVNALVGQSITAQTSFGPGTETVIAYAHADQVAALRDLLEAEVPGRYSVVEHRVAELSRQVLLDLPDIDSHWGDHVAVTRKMLRHMLFPVWVQSVEKYADGQPQELLSRVAAGNTPGNFVFCLNKVDQIDRLGDEAVRELRADYAARIARVLQLDAPPRVWVVAAVMPDRFELPELRALLAQQKSEEDVRDSRARAAARQQASVLAWFDSQNLPERAARLQRLEEDTQDEVNDRLGEPLLGGLLPKLLDDPSYVRALSDECLTKRMSHWPILNVLHPLFSAVGGFISRNAEAKARPMTLAAGEARVDEGLANLADGSAAPRPLAERLQAAFASLQQTHPAVSELYRDRKLWESLPASETATALRDSLAATVNRQRTEVCSRASSSQGTLAAAMRGLLTIGAVLWFPLIQPLVHTLHANFTATRPEDQRSITGVLVDLLSLQNFMQSLTGLFVYFLVLWIVLRWRTQRGVLRLLAQWKQADAADKGLSLTARIVEWLEGLVEPVRKERGRADAVVKRIEEIRTNPKSE